MTQPVSGPGRLSRRTDTGPAQKLRDLPDAQYGEAATFRGLQHDAPLAQAPPQRVSGSQAGGAPQTLPTPLSAPSQRPGEPITSGASAGPGPGTGALGLPAQPIQMRGSLLDTLAQLQPYDVTGAVADLIAQAGYRGR